MNPTTIGGDTRATDRVARSVRIGALAGIVGPLMFTLTFFIQEALRRDERISKFVRFIRKQDPAARFQSAMPKDRRRR